VEATVAGTAIASSADDVTIRGAGIEKFAYNGINTAANGWTIDNTEIRYIHFQGIGIYGGSGHVIQDTRVHHCGIIGMTAVEVDDFTVQGNEFDHNNYLGAGARSGGYHEGAVKILKSHDVVFRDNWSHHNDGDGLWFDFDNYDILIENNVLESNTRNGLHYEASFDATVRYNTIRDNGTDWDSFPAGILNSTSKNVEYYGNRLEDNVIRSIVITWTPRGQSATLGERQSANLYFHDNVIVLDDNFQSWVGVYWDQDPRVFSSNNRFQGNTYHYAQGAGESWWLWDDTRLTWAQWRAKGFDTTGSYHPN
jgi:parallel beta-helix repeat protein